MYEHIMMVLKVILIRVFSDTGKREDEKKKTKNINEIVKYELHGAAVKTLIGFVGNKKTTRLLLLLLLCMELRAFVA